MQRRVFYSFHYEADNWRAAQVRNIGVLESNNPCSDNDWESLKSGGDQAIERWIADQLSGRSCTVVLVGARTANRRWINHEIVKSWDSGKGVVGVYIHGLMDRNNNIALQGDNPFSHIGYGNTGRKLSSIVKCYDPPGSSSQDRYNWIRQHLANAVEEAIHIRTQN